VCDLKPGYLTWSVGNAHIYENLVGCVEEQLKRKPTCWPIIQVKKRDNITDFTYEDINLVGYSPQPAIKVIMNP
jgi:thymidylate synthase